MVRGLALGLLVLMLAGLASACSEQSSANFLEPISDTGTFAVQQTSASSGPVTMQ